jgi:rhodanese-related sulfurtransferase
MFLSTFIKSHFYLSLFLLDISSVSSTDGKHIESMPQDEYQCIPCGSDCDKEVYSKPGSCSHCQMQLVKKSTIIFKTIQPSDLCNYIQTHPNVVLLDVRTKEEFEGKSNPNYGAIRNAINLPIQVLESQLSTLDQYKDKEIIVYCSHSRRSPRASYILSQNGFSNITNLAGGMSAMKDRACMK